jgi:hypothetical protein
MKTLDQLTNEDFESRVGETFRLGKHAVTLKDVKTGQAGHQTFRTQISLVFEAESDIGVTSDITTLSHPDLGLFELLVHRIEDPENPDGPPHYEIIFN